MLELCRTDERDKSRGCLHTMRCKEEEDKVNVSKLNEVKQVQDDFVYEFYSLNVMLNSFQHLTASHY